MDHLWAAPLTDPSALDLRRAEAEVAEWCGRAALRVAGGLALLPDLQCADARVTVWVGAEGPAYPGIAFRVADPANYELAYATPHANEQWDAIQYDPVFRSSNTWQLYHGPAYQAVATVPTGRWFQLAVTCCGGRAAVAVDGQLPLIVSQLAHPVAA